MTEKVAYTILLNQQNGQPAKFVIPNELVTFPSDSDNHEFMFMIAEDSEGKVEFLCSEDINYITTTDPDNPNSLAVFKSVRGDRWPVHTEKAVLQMTNLMGKLLVIDGGR
ncbi:hypothetical protein [Paenibacillus sp. L3-i20]|uniref:hypothetical protein n=1 Tax=Paenibacillus sp. L3-i20 TaxID=2905833 RepID=UPI001EE116D0|nr:hypothetical protein [Paenibacillus sp. L3-i20]GKU79879.1 hypothetical protein L3i20_v242760 [Paenibacillus sp. L3-i20]